MADQPADCFLAHSGDDKPAVEALAHRLRQENIELWLDSWNLIPGRPWQPAIEDALATSRACAVFIGPSGLGPWQSAEMRAAIQRRIGSGGFPVIPVLLPGASRGPRSLLPPFLMDAEWVDFRDSLEDAEAFRRLVCGIRGMAPGPAPESAPYRGECPYLGLRTFREEEARLFFGRETRTEWLLDKIRPTGSIAGEHRFLAVIGASGSGKSSLVRAGLIPAVRAGRLPGSAAWPIIVLRPGYDPLESLAIALAADSTLGKVAPDLVTLIDRFAADAQWLHLLVRQALHQAEPEQRAVIVVDQLEELFTLSEHEERRRAFIDILLYAASISGGQALVIITMRADFYGKCAVYANLAAALSEQPELVSPMNEDELRRAIERPALLTGHELEPGLTELLVQHMRGRAGTLPLLQHALAELWRNRAGRRLTLATYREMGSLEGALEQHAEKVFGELSEEEQDICQRILLRLVQPGEGTEDTRRRALQAELGSSDATDRVLAKLADARLVTTERGDGRQGHGYVEISHEALIRGWSRLRGWIENSRDRLKIQHRLATAAQEWSERRAQPNGEDYLYRGARLAEIEEQSAHHGVEMTDLERAFLEASIALRDREEQEREAQHQRELERERAAAARLRRRGRIIAGVGGLALVGAIAALMLFFQAQSATKDLQTTNKDLKQANSEARERLMRIHATNGVNERDRNHEPLKAMHYFARAAEQAVDAAAERNWRIAAEYLAGHLALHAIMAHEESVYGAKFSPDETRVLTWSWNGTARVWDAGTGKAITPALQPKGKVGGAEWSPDGARVLTWGKDGTAQVWDASTAKALTPALQHKNAVEGAAWSQDGARVLTWSFDGTARVWDASTGKALTPSLQHDAEIAGAAWSQDGARVLTWSFDGTARVWEAKTGKALTPSLQHKDDVEGAAWSPDGAQVLTWSEDGTAQVWEARTGKALTPALQHKDSVNGAAWSSDGAQVLTWSFDGTARVWDARTGKALITPALQHKDSVNGAAWSPDGAQVLTWSMDGTARVWDASTGKDITPVLQHKGDVDGAEWSQDGARVQTWSFDGTARVWDARTGKALTPALQHKSDVWGAAWNQDGARVLTWSRDGTARLWEAGTGKAITPVLQHEDDVDGAEWSQDGARVLTWSEDGTARLWEASTGKALAPELQHKGGIRGVARSPDGARVLTWSKDGTAQVWEASTGKLITLALQQHQGKVRGAAWSPDGARVLTWSKDGTAQAWEARTGKAVTTELQHQGKVRGAAWSPDGARVLTWSTDGMAQVWDATTGYALLPALQHEDEVEEAAWSPDGTRVLTRSSDGTVRVWEPSTSKVMTLALQHEGEVEGAAWSPDGARVLTWSPDGTARLWDQRTGPAVTPALQHDGPVRGAAWSPDGERVLTWSEDKTARVWDPRTGQALIPALQHERPVRGAAWSPDEGWVLTWSEDRTARVWDAGTGQALTPALQHERSVTGAKWSPDGARVLTWSEDGTARLWQLENDTSWPKERLALRYEALSGTRLSLAGDLEVIPADEWYALKQRYDEIARSLEAGVPGAKAP